MSKQAYIAEVDALRASPALRAKVASLPNRRRRRPRSFSWVGLASALVLVVGLGVAAPAILRAIAPPGGQLDPPPVVTQSPVPEGIIAEGIDVSPVILDAAREYVRERYAYQSEHNAAPVLVDGEFQAGPVAIFDNWRIESLTVAYERKELGTYTVAVYQLDYRLHTTTPERVVLAGAAEVDGEGWYLDTYPGCTYLVFLLDYSSPHYFATMLNDCSPGSALFDESLLQDIETYLDRLKGEESPPEASTAPYAMQGVSINEIDYTALEQQMTAEEWKALQPYLPMLRDGGSFYKVWEDDHTGEKMGPVEMTLDEFYQERFGLDSPDGKLDLEKLTLFGFEGDGTQDLILGYFNGGGNYLILHREGEKIYGTERGYRSFMQLQTDGTFMGSAGADDNYYYRLAFQNGRFVEELLGHKTGAYCEIGGISVSEEYFTNWRENLMGSDMWWYNPAPMLGYTRNLNRVAITGFPLERPMKTLDAALLDTLKDSGEVEDLRVTHPEWVLPWLLKTYRSPSLEVQTLMVPTEMLEQSLADGSITRAQYDESLETEYIFRVRPLDDSYATGLGLRLGDSVAQAQELSYSLSDTGEQTFNAGLSNLIVTTEGGVVTGLLSSSGGRTVGPFFY